MSGLSLSSTNVTTATAYHVLRALSAYHDIPIGRFPCLKLSCMARRVAAAGGRRPAEGSAGSVTFAASGLELVGSTYETKIILPGAPVTEPETEPDKAAGAGDSRRRARRAAAGGDARA